MSAPTFTQWVASTGLVLTPAQRAVWRVLGDGIEPGEDELSRTLFGGALTIPPLARRCGVLRKGARVGGTMLCAYRVLYLALTVPLNGLAPGELASAPIVGPDMRLARQALTFVVGLVEQLGLDVSAKGADGIRLVRADHREVLVECLPATAGGRAIRGRSIVAALFTELAFFRDENYAVNDAEIYRAVQPRIVDGGQLLCESTPWAESGLLYTLDTENFGKPYEAVIAHTPTALMRPEKADEVEAERRRDPMNAAREFDGEYLTIGTGLFFDPVAIDACVDETLALESPRKGTCTAGADFAFERDSSALAIADTTRENGGTVVTIRALAEEIPTRGKPLVTGEVVSKFALTMKKYGAGGLTADAHYRRAVVEHLQREGLTFEDAPGGLQGKADSYIRTRELVNAGRFKIPNHPKLIAQFKAILSKPKPGGGLSVFSPRRGKAGGGGGHGDLVSAVVCAVWRSALRPKRERVVPPPIGFSNFESSSVGSFDGSSDNDEHARIESMKRALGL